MSLAAHAKYERKYGMILLGTQYSLAKIMLLSIDLLFAFHRRTLATDKGFKERVQEDMLVRLLDAFVWRSNGMQNHPMQIF